MTKEKLIVDFSEEDFLLYGIISDVREFKLAWQINNFLDISLFMQDDMCVEFKNNRSQTVTYYSAQEEFYNIRLVKNLVLHSVGVKMPYLIPEIKNFDFLFVVEGEDVSCFDEANLFAQLKKASFIQYISKIDIDKLKSLDNLIF